MKSLLQRLAIDFIDEKFLAYDEDRPDVHYLPLGIYPGGDHCFLMILAEDDGYYLADNTLWDTLTIRAGKELRYSEKIKSIAKQYGYDYEFGSGVLWTFETGKRAIISAIIDYVMLVGALLHEYPDVE